MEQDSQQRRIVATEAERITLHELEQTLAITQKLQIVDAEGKHIQLPASLIMLLRQSVVPLEQGETLIITHTQQELTTQEAADILNISRPSLIKLLDAQIISHRMVGTHRRIALADVLAYQQRYKQEQTDALDRLTQLSQEYGLYDDV